jgi:hypothetical protein
LSLRGNGQCRHGYGKKVNLPEGGHANFIAEYHHGASAEVQEIKPSKWRMKMKNKLDKGDFWDLFKSKAILVSELPSGKARDLAERVNRSDGHADATLHTKAEFKALFALLDSEMESPAGDGMLILKDGEGNLTVTGNLVSAYINAAKGKEAFFDSAMFMVMIEDWPQQHLTPEDPVYADGSSSLSAWATDPSLATHLPPAGEQGVLLQTKEFSLKNSGNRTLRAPKRSWKINFKVGEGDDGKVLGMWRFNLKAMYNDPSQMREALAWRLFDQVGIPASRHSYAKLGINGHYRGLFSLIEQVDKGFLKDHFGKHDEGNLYKAYCGNVGCATLEFKPPTDGDTGLPYYLDHTNTDLTYRLKTNDDEAEANSYADLAHFIETLNGIGLAGGDEKFRSDAYMEQMEGIMNVKAFLRWAGANLLLGGWDNYYATPSNYYLYNAGRKGAKKAFMHEPYFYWIPWDYDNSFGIDYFNTQWQYTDILDWASNTGNYYQGKGTAKIPLVQNLLKHDAFIQYYLDHLEHMLDKLFNPDAFDVLMGQEGDGGLWDRVRQAAYLESDSPHGAPFTGRQFSNHQVYLNGLRQWELSGGNYQVEGIIHYVRMRHDSAREQLARLRKDYPSGASGENFSDILEMPPGVN